MTNPVTFRNPPVSSNKQEDKDKPKLDWAHLSSAQLPEQAATLLETILDADRELRALLAREILPPEGKIALISTPVDVKRNGKVGIAYTDARSVGPEVKFRSM